MGQAFKVVGVAVAAAAATFAVLTKKSIDAADNLAKLSQSTGLSVESLSGLGHSAELAGSSTEELGQSIQQLSKRIVDAGRGSKLAEDAFKSLGVQFKDNRGQARGVEAVMFDVADAFARMKDGTVKTNAAMQLFGANLGGKLIPFLNQSAKGIRAGADEAERMGLIISTKTAKAAEQFNDNLTRLAKLGTRVGTVLAAELAPGLVRVTDRLVDFTSNNENIKKFGRIIGQAFDDIAVAAETVAAGVSVVSSALKKLGDLSPVDITIRLFFGPPRKEMQDLIQEFRDDLSKSLTFDKEFADLSERLGTFADKTFARLGANLEKVGGEISTSLNRVKATITDLNKVIVESPVAKPLFDPNALISQKEELEFISRALGGIPSEVGKIGGAFEALKGPLVDVSVIGETLTRTLSSGFQNLILSGGKFSDVLSNLAKQLAGMFLQIALLNTLKGIFGGIGILGFQHGGRPQVGRPAVVGEAGPEIFIPDRPGRIIANDAIQSVARGAGSKTVIIEQHFDFRGAGPGVEAAARRAIRLAAQEIRALTKADIVEASLRSA